MVEWRDVVGYEQLYAVSSDGRVESKRFSRVMKPTSSGQGYPKLVLHKEGRPKTFTVHVLMALAFLGPRPEGMFVCHNNGIKTDNRLENIRYDTPGENSLDMERHGSNFYRNKTHCPRGHSLTTPNLVAGKARNGLRACRACHRARSAVFNKPSRNFDTEANRIYQEQLSSH